MSDELYGQAQLLENCSLLRQIMSADKYRSMEAIVYIEIYFVSFCFVRNKTEHFRC